ncbi:DUF6257 family protein [Streptomyces roseochromogenus]|uniref:Uncharacterized protein n=1 Tax=Streptomyces roseochromogenus subsp. oscitans DS 12.976 TaxID=1352936 RepID=V6K0N9_STRRC|nr:DUF6257 family protein [Streptomyces roseochromogenus]EST25795.1 hypothetical protein M878_28075 [Streptomyces roseochromogenus subsp. oscitans DS 12.976]
MSSKQPRLTAGEKAQLAWYVARMAKRGLADDRQYGGRVDQSDLQRKYDRVLAQARKREERANKDK